MSRIPETLNALPVFSFKEIETTDYIEPLPTKAKQWMLWSKLGAILGIVLVLAGTVITTLGLTDYQKNRRIIKSLPIQTQSQLAQHLEAEKQLRTLPEQVKQASQADIILSALRSNKNYRLSRAQTEMTLEITAPKEENPLETINTLSAALQEYGWESMADPVTTDAAEGLTVKIVWHKKI